jgi:uncharacterized protein YdeI (YjbR/CyaY-like superfamily)
MPTETKHVYAKNRKVWRAWLKKNHKKESKVNLIKYKKHTKKPSLSHHESMEEAICFGWIDTTIKRLDEARYQNTFVKRNKNSRWSNATLGYAKDLIKKGMMSPFGLKIFKEGLKKPVIDHNLPRNPKIPKDLKQALETNKRAKQNFNNMAPSYKRFYIYRVKTAKREETRKKRINEVLKRAKENKKPGI